MEFFHWVRSSPHLAIVPIEGAVLFELVTGLKFNKDFFEYRKYFIRQSGDRNWIFISHIWNLIAHGDL